MQRRMALRGLMAGAAGGAGLLASLRPVAAQGAAAQAVSDDIVDVKRAGAQGDGRADDTAALNAAFASAREGKTVVLPAGRYRITGTVKAPAGCHIEMRGHLFFDGDAALPALEIGAPREVCARRRYSGIDVRRARQSDWSSAEMVGVRHYNPHGCISVAIDFVGNFTIGYQMLAAGSGVGLNTVHLGRFQNNMVGLDLRSAAGPGNYVNQNSFIGGWFTVAFAANLARPRYGVRFSAEPGGYRAHNNNVFLNPCFELSGEAPWRPGVAVAEGAYMRDGAGTIWRAQGAGRTGARAPAGSGRASDGAIEWQQVAPARDSLPLLAEVAANHNRVIAARSEGNGAIFARHMEAGSNANLYEIAFAWNDRELRIEDRGGRSVGSRIVAQFPAQPPAR